MNLLPERAVTISGLIGRDLLLRVGRPLLDFEEDAVRAGCALAIKSAGHLDGSPATLERVTDYIEAQRKLARALLALGPVGIDSLAAILLARSCEWLAEALLEIEASGRA